MQVMGRQSGRPHLALTTEAVGETLQPLLGPLRRAIAEGRPVITVQQWAPIPYAALLPFHLQLCWPDQVDELPLQATICFVPYTGHDRSLAHTALYAPEEAYASRRFAGWYRNETGTVMPKDLHLQDWEEGYLKHRAELRGRVLPPCAYIAIASVQPSGAIRRAPRPTLGRFASRQAYRPEVLVPGRGADAQAALEQLAQGTLVIVNLQEARGMRTRRMVMELLARRAHAPTLVIAGSPTDVLSLGPDPMLETLPIELLGDPPQVCSVAVTTVGRDRPQEEVRFAAAVEALRGYTPRMEPLLDLAKHAWWAARQTLDERTSARSGVLERFAAALERYQRTDPLDAGLLTMASNLLAETVEDGACARERCEATLAAAERHLHHPRGWRTLIVVPGAAEAVAMRDSIAAHFAATWDDIRALGLDVRSIHSIRGGEPYDMVVATGYMGARTLDIPFFARARLAHLILDPVEARVALLHAQRVGGLLSRASRARSRTDPASQLVGTPPEATLARMHAALTAAAMRPSDARVALDPRAAVRVRAPDTERLETLGDLDELGRIADGALEVDADPAVGGGAHVLVAFTDGTSLLCAADRRLEVLDESARGFHAVQAGELRSGGEVIRLEDGRRALFSEHLMRMLDESELREHRARRDRWLALTADMRTLRNRSIRSIHSGLKARGVSVDTATVRSWLAGSDSATEGLVPRSWAGFRALADELGLAIPEPTLRSYFDSIRRWRILHRVRGRQLVRMMRHAALGNLDPATLDRIEAAWGLDTRDLVAGARLCIVEECAPW